MESQPTGIIYAASLDGIIKYVGQELQYLRFDSAKKLLDHREKRHVRDALSGKFPCPAFGRAIVKHGSDAFSFTILHVFHASNREELQKKADELETCEIARHNTLAPNGYNLTTGGQKGYVYSKEVCELISQKLKESFTDERRREISERNSKVTPNDEDQLVADYTNGVSASDLAKKYNVTLTTITSRLKARDIEIVWGKGGHYATGANHPQAVIDEATARAIYSRRGTQTGRATATEFGVTPQLVSKIWTKQKWKHIHDDSTPA